MTPATHFTYTPAIDLQPIEDLTRREFMFSAFGAALLIACGDDEPEADPTATPTPDSRFPVSIDHKFGTTEIAAEPQRVLSLGFSDHDAILALGVEPIAIRYWYSDDAVFPWAQDRLSGTQPPVLDMPPGTDLDFEAILAQAPDLIVAVYSGITQEDYDRLAQIAPTVAQSGDFVDYGMPWQETTLLIGRALGRQDRAQALIDEIDARMAAIRNEHPELVGAQAIVAALRPDGAIRFYAAQDPRTRSIISFGFEVPEAVASLFGDTFVTDISGEQIDLLETADIVVWRNTRAELEGNEIYWTLDVAGEGRHIFMDDLGQINEAFSFSTVLSLPYFIDSFVPLLEAALDGDPVTVAE